MGNEAGPGSELRKMLDKTPDRKTILSLKDIHKTYVQGNSRLNVLKGVALSVQAGEMVAL